VAGSSVCCPTLDRTHHVPRHSAIALVLALSVIVALVKRALCRVVAYAALAGVTLLLIEYVTRPLVHRSYGGSPTFPSGHVTAVSAAALAMRLGLSPLSGKWTRHGMVALGVGWVLLISLAVLGGHWHTPVDVIGLLLLSIGIVATGALVIESIVPVKPQKRRETSARTLQAPFGRKR
jgi:membrane-associated phospholipid phosphatase